MSDYIPTTGEVRNSYWKGTALRSEDHAREDAAFDRWLAQNDIETQRVALAWERERFDRLWQIEMDVCKCEEAMQHLKIRMERTENAIDYQVEFGDNK